MVRAVVLLVCLGLAGPCVAPLSAGEARGPASIPSPNSVPIPATASFGQESPEDGPADELASLSAAELPHCGGVDEVYFATNRDPVPFVAEPERFASSLRRTALFGRARLDPASCRPADGGLEVEVGNVGLALADPLQFALAATSGENEIIGTLGLTAGGPLIGFAERVTDGEADVLAYVHGAGHTFASSVANAARLASAIKRDGVAITVLLFAYPTAALATPLSYLSDRRDAAMSAVAMADAFQALTHFLRAARAGSNGRTVLFAHGLGARLLGAGALDLPGDQPAFDAAILVAPDAGADALAPSGELRPLLQLAQEVAVYFAADDPALSAANLGRTKPPLGRAGPRYTGSAGGRVSAIEVAALPQRADLAAHRYHLSSASVLADLKAVFSGTPPDAVVGRTRPTPNAFRLTGEAAP